MSNPASTSSVSFVTKLVRFFVRLLVTLVIAGLAALVVYLLSQENARTFTLHVVEDTLIIHKGKSLPFGSSPWHTEDPAYDTLKLEGFQPNHMDTAKYSGTEELDKALFPILESLAKSRILSEEPVRQERGLYYLQRAELLKGLSQEQQNALKALRAEASFYVARTRLLETELFMRETINQFRLAAQAPNRNTQSAIHALNVLEPALKQLSLSIQNALAYRGPPPHLLDSMTTPTPPPQEAPTNVEPAAEPSGKTQE